MHTSNNITLHSGDIAKLQEYCIDQSALHSIPATLECSWSTVQATLHHTSFQRSSNVSGSVYSSQIMLHFIPEALKTTQHAEQSKMYHTPTLEML